MLLTPDAPKIIAIEVDYYSSAEADLFAAGAYPHKWLKRLAPSTIEVVVAEFLTYSLFWLKDKQAKRYPTLESLKPRLKQADKDLNEWVQWCGSSIRVDDKADGLERHIAQHIGDAVALTVANRIHHTDEADWHPIRRHGNAKILDWHRASNGKKHIELEAKGRVVDSHGGNASVRAAYSEIKKQKEAAKAPDYHRSPALRYGAITAISRKEGRLLRCLLVDPEGSEPERDPVSDRVLHRLSWAAWLLGIICPRSSLATALGNRLAALELAGNVMPFSSEPLRKGNGESADFQMFTNSRSMVADVDAAGSLTRYDREHLLFAGIHMDWIELLAKQDFEGIMGNHFEPETFDTKVDCKFTTLQVHQMGLGRHLSEWQQAEGPGYRSITLPARIHLSPAGMAFGLVKLPPQNDE